jgi:DNA-binding response OmpR family regulator
MATKGMSIQPARILVVDDERHIARFLEFVLKKAGYEVAIAHNGEQALAAGERFEPDAMLLDLVLPGISGLEILKRLRSNGKHAPCVVMVLSARSFGDAPVEVMEAGANAHATKPIAPSTILKKLLELGVPPTQQVPHRSALPDEVGHGTGQS